MNRECNSKISSKNCKRLLKNWQNMTGDYCFAAPCSFYAAKPVSAFSVHESNTVSVTRWSWLLS